MNHRNRRKGRIGPGRIVNVSELAQSAGDPPSEFLPSYIPKFNTPEKFLEAKIKMLEEDFYITLTEEEKQYLKEFKTEQRINAAIRNIINKHWDKE